MSLDLLLKFRIDVRLESGLLGFVMQCLENATTTENRTKMLDGKCTCRVFLCVISGLAKNPKLPRSRKEIFTIIKIKLLNVNGKEKILKVARK